MGLPEKRAIEDAGKWLPKREKEVQDISGAPIKYEVDWNTFENDLKGIQWLENNGPNEVSKAFRMVCKDQLGKDAVKGAVKKVVFKNAKDAKDKKLSLAKGVLEVQGAFALGTSGRVADMEIAKLLEKSL